MSTTTQTLDVDVTALAARIAALPARAGLTRIVAIDGPSGAGKTTLARALADPPHVAVVHMDDVYPGWDGLDAAAARILEDVLRPLAAGRPASIRRWDWKRGCDGARDAVPPASTLIVEGAGAAPRAADPYLSLLIWVEAEAGERRRRAIARDGDTYAPHWERWAFQERATFAREDTRTRADLVIRTSRH